MHMIVIPLVLLILFAAPITAAEDSIPISYYEIKPSLVANLARGGKYIRTDIQLMTKDENYRESLDLHGPAIRHTLLLLLSSIKDKAAPHPWVCTPACSGWLFKASTIHNVPPSSANATLLLLLLAIKLRAAPQA